MNSRYNGSMGYQRLIKEIKRDVGGPPGPDSVGTSQIINGTITTADISNEAITQAKLHPDVQIFLANVGQDLYNLKNPGFYGTFKFTNDNSSDSGATLTITVDSVYHNSVSNTYETQPLLRPAETINKGNHYTITIPISERLTNKDTKIRMYYTINKANIEVLSGTIFAEDDKSQDVNGDYFDFVFDGNYDDNNGGNAEISFIIDD
jgi:hypothetical protein